VGFWRKTAGQSLLKSEKEYQELMEKD